MMFKGIVLGPTLQLSHMFYADDAVFVGQWSDANIDTLVHVLDCFHRASGMRINMNKRKLMGISFDEVKVTIVAFKIGYFVLKTPFSYLDEDTFNWWKVNTSQVSLRFNVYLSYVNFKVPMRVLQRLESIQSHFFNGNDIHGKKLSWVKWKKILASKEKGGLGVSSLYALNRGLLLKWVCRFITQSSSLWARVIKEIHRDDGKIGKNAKSNYPSIWLDIVHKMEVLNKQGIDVSNCIKIKLGNRENTSFWNDIWREDSALKYLYPRLYALESCKDVNVALTLSHARLDFSFRRAPSGGAEEEQLIELSNQIEGVILTNSRDR
nr:RNA-directed DNA polymerase, eukaryota, reverse transcriptase zinc-binding domain protein [Tanacetum cinerariifolium]